MTETENFTGKDIHGTWKMGYKKTANYGIAVNQVLFPLGNDNANIHNVNDNYNFFVSLKVTEYGNSQF